MMNGHQQWLISTYNFGKTTNRELYKYRNVMEYVNDSYVLTNPISDTNIKEMRMNMEDSDVVAFDAFLERNWGIKPPKINMVQQPTELDFSKVKEAIPVSASVDTEKKQEKVVKKKTPEEMSLLAKRKKELARKNEQKSVTKSKISPEKKVTKSKKTDEKKKKTTRSSILGNIDMDEEEN